MALLDTIKSNLQTMSQPAQVGGVSDQTAGVQALSQAKTGRVSTSAPAPRATNLQEQVASGQAALGAQQVQREAKLQAEQLGQAEAAQATEAKLRDRELDEHSLSMHDAFANQATAIASQFARDNRELDFRKDRARLEQLGIATRLSNDQYTTQLEQEGMRSRLDNEIAFDEALQQAIWDDQNELFKSDLEFKEALSGKQSDWNEYMAAIDRDQFVYNAEAAAAANKKAMQWQAISSMTSAGAGAYGQQQQGAFDKKFQETNQQRELNNQAPLSYGAYNKQQDSINNPTPAKSNYDTGDLGGGGMKS